MLVQKGLQIMETKKFTFRRSGVIIVGSGAAGLNAAIALNKQGIQDVTVLTEGLTFGTSRNTGSDKQTYYKLTSSGTTPDSVRQMAQTLFDGGCVDGDIALAEAAVSTRAFFHLVDIGVPFPCNRYGEYVGYKTDHDPFKRGISAGPLTSRYMTERLIEEAKELGVRILEGYQALEILTAPDGEQKKAIGVLALEYKKQEPTYAVFGAANVIYATGGEAGMYKTSVYPTAQTGGTGLALRAGARGKNLTESQYGIASIKFRWNLSGSYQQVLPCYISTDENGGDEREFLEDAFPDAQSQLNAIFLKGYQWPFDPRKTRSYGSSLIDILIYIETVQKKRRVFLDYRRNPRCALTDGKMDYTKLSEEALEYLRESGSMQELPIQRLAAMNPAAIELYRSHNIDLAAEPLEIAICAQHNNGGLAGDCWWQSNIRHLYPIGEVNGTHGVYRPGGTALNAGQVGGIRAASYIAHHDAALAPPDEQQVLAAAGEQIWAAMEFGMQALQRGGSFDVAAERAALQERMSCCGAVIRGREAVQTACEEALQQLHRIEKEASLSTPLLLGQLYRLRDLAVSQFVYLSAIRNYIQQGGRSRGSYLICDPAGEKPLGSLPEIFRFVLEDGTMLQTIQEVEYAQGACTFYWRGCRPIPETTEWFEKVWQEYRKGAAFQ